MYCYDIELKVTDENLTDEKSICRMLVPASSTDEVYEFIQPIWSHFDKHVDSLSTRPEMNILIIDVWNIFRASDNADYRTDASIPEPFGVADELEARLI